MPKQVTFIHAADLHLGAPFRGLRAISPKWAKRLLSAIAESYDRVIDAAIDHKVDFVVFAGDIFDNSQPSYADYLRFFEGLNRLDDRGIKAYLCTGNHDPYTSWQQDFFAFPPNATMLPGDRPGFELFEKDGEPLALIGGRGFYNQAWPSDQSIAEGVTRQAAEEATGTEAPFAIGILHTGLDLDLSKAPVDPATLIRSGMDYWALGHIHKRHQCTEADPRIVFPGCIQGRDINETGERGVFLVTLAEGRPSKAEFLPTASVVWQRMSIDVADCMNLVEVNEKIMREMFVENGKAKCEEMCVRITLTGKTRLHSIFATPGVVEDMRQSINDAYPVFFCDALVDRTEQPLDKEALKKEGLFPAVYLQVSEAFRSDKDEEVAYLQDEFLKKGIQLPKTCEKNVVALSEEAENLVLDLLGGAASQ